MYHRDITEYITVAVHRGEDGSRRADRKRPSVRHPQRQDGQDEELHRETRQGKKEKIQGDHSGIFQPPVDIKTEVAFQHMLLIPKLNFCFDVNRRLGTT